MLNVKYLVIVNALNWKKEKRVIKKIIHGYISKHSGLDSKKMFTNWIQ